MVGVLLGVFTVCTPMQAVTVLPFVFRRAEEILSPPKEGWWSDRAFNLCLFLIFMPHV